MINDPDYSFIPIGNEFIILLDYKGVIRDVICKYTYSVSGIMSILKNIYLSLPAIFSIIVTILKPSSIKASIKVVALVIISQ